MEGIPQEIMKEGQNVFAALTQRIDFQRNDVQTVKQVASEGTVPNACFQWLIGCRDDTHVYVDDFITANTHNLLFLEDTEQL